MHCQALKCIVTGPRIDLAIALINRMKKLFASSKGIAATFDTKETVIELNNVKITEQDKKDIVRAIASTTEISVSK